MVRNFLLITAFILFSVNSFAQRFSHYFTNTLFESFENPAQTAFTPDSSRMMAFNFFVPNFTANAALSGHSQDAIKQYLFVTNPSVQNIQIGKGLHNNAFANANAYLFMFKIFTSLNGNQEIGFSEQVRGEGKTLFTDETVGLFDTRSYFNPNQNYTNLFNDKYKFQVYHQLSFTYRRNINPGLSLGLKMSLLSGIVYQENKIDYSNVNYDRSREQVNLTLQGQNRTNYDPGTFGGANIIPSFDDPGASLSVSILQKTEDGFRFQYNLKDVGFIHWSRNSNIYNYNTSAAVSDLNSKNSGDSVYHQVMAIFQQNPTRKSFNSPTDGRFEFALSRSYWLNYNKTYQYTPVGIISKQLFDRGLAAAMVNNFRYKNLTLGLTTSYNEMRQVYIGGQLMVRSPNAEFFIGCEQLYPGYNFAESALGSANAITKIMPYSAAGFFMGFSLKFGRVIESNANASYVPYD